MSIRINNKIISGTYTSQSYRYVGEIFQSALPIEDSRVALLDGHKIYESEGYGSFIQYITSLALLYPQLSCTEDEWQLSDTTYGECGKFVISEDSVRLPKIVSFVQGLGSLQDLATLVEAGLPNITGAVNSRGLSTSNAYGCLYNNGTANNAIAVAEKASSTTTGQVDVSGSVKSDLVTIDASKSNPTYGNSTTVQPQSIRYPYYIVLATGVTQEVKVKEELTTNIPFTLFESKYSEVELNNTSWLLSSGQWNSKELYPSAYNELVKEYNAPTRLHNVVLHSDTYTDYDFVLNLENEIFRLPLKIKQRFYEDIAPVAGNGMTLGLTDGINNIGLSNNASHILTAVTGNYGQSVGNINTTYLNSTNNTGFGVTTDSTKSGIEAHLTETVNLYLYFYVGDTNVNVSLVDTGKLTQEVANLIPNNSSLISGYSMPSSRYVDLELGASGTQYIAPANGYYMLIKGSGLSTATLVDMVNRTTQYRFQSNINDASGSNHILTIMARKGDVVEVKYSATGNTLEFKFIYAQGEI